MTPDKFDELQKEYLQSEIDYMNYIRELAGSPDGQITNIRISTRFQLDRLTELEHKKSDLFDKWRKGIVVSDL